MVTCLLQYRWLIVLRSLLCFLLMFGLFQSSVRADQPKSKVDGLIESMLAVSDWLGGLEDVLDRVSG
jgi:hypothetical protein